MSITATLAHNMQRLIKEYDISGRELAERASMPQKTVWNMINGKYSCRLDNLEQIANTFFVSPAAMITPHLPMNVLMSRRLSRFIEAYAKLDMEQREKLELFIDGLQA